MKTCRIFIFLHPFDNGSIFSVYPNGVKIFNRHFPFYSLKYFRYFRKE